MSNIPSYLMLPIKPLHSQLPNTPRTDRFWEWLRIIGSKTLSGGRTALSKPFSMWSEDGKRLGETLKALFPSWRCGQGPCSIGNYPRKKKICSILIYANEGSTHPVSKLFPGVCVTVWNAFLGIGNVFLVSWDQGNELRGEVFCALNLRVDGAFFFVL